MIKIIFVGLMLFIFAWVVVLMSVPRKDAVNCEWASFHPDYKNEARAQCKAPK